MIRRIAFITTALAALIVGPAYAQTQSNSGSQSQAIAIAGGSGNDGSVQRTRGRLATTASAIGPGLTAAGVHSCAGSVSAAGGGVGFGLSLGSTYEMQECNRRAYAATLMGMGQNLAALALVCNNSEVKNALNLTGVSCPQDAAVAAAQVQRVYAASQGSQGSVVTSRGATIRTATPWRD